MMTTSTRAAMALIAGLACGQTAIAGATYSFQGLGQIESDGEAVGLRISADGSTVVGTLDRTGFNDRAFRWTSDTGVQLLDLLPGGNTSQGIAVSGDGSFVVGTVDTTEPRPVRWDAAGVPLDLGLTPSRSRGSGVSRDGQAVALSGFPFSPPSRWTQSGGHQQLGFLPGGTLATVRQMSLDGNVIVGEGNSSARTADSFRWTQATGMVSLGIVPGFVSTAAKGTNADGSVVVGITQSLALGFRGFRWTEAAGMSVLGIAPGDSSSQAFACSGDCSIIVGANNLQADSHPLVWLNDSQPLRLDHLLRDVIPAGWTLQSALSISEDGRTVMGLGLHNGRTETWVATIPSPGVASFVLASFALCARRRR